MKQGRHVLVLSVVAALATPVAHAAGRLSIVGLVPFTGLKKDSPSTEYKAQMGKGGGLLYELGSGHTGLELGALYAPRKVVIGEAQTWTYVEVPVLLRFHLGRAFSIGAGGYYAFMMGDIKLDSGGTTTASVAGVKTSDYGVVGSAALQVPMGKKTSLRIDGRYLMGMNNVNTVGPATVKWSGYEALVGLTFGGGK